MKNLFSFFLFMGMSLSLFAQAQQATLLGNWFDSDIRGSSFYNNAYNEVWGMAVNGREFAVIGSTFGTHIIDVTNPEQPLEVARIRGRESSTGVVHRDYHDYKGYLYAVCDEGNSSLQIIDISGLPDRAEIVYDDDRVLKTAHNIFIDTANARLYSFAAGSPSTPGLRGVGVFDLSDPVAPRYLTHFNTFGGLRPDHVHDGYVRDHIAFLNAAGLGMAMMDFSDLNNPRALGILPSNGYLQSGYNHSGWATNDCRFYAMADETWGMDLKLVDIRNLEDINVVAYFDAESQAPTSIPHNLLIACNYLFVSYYYDGLQIYDISDPAVPKRVLYYDTCTEPDERNYKGAWGVFPYLPSGNILVSDMQNGLFVVKGPTLDCHPSENLAPCGSSLSSLNSPGVGLANTRVYPNPALNNIRIDLPDSLHEQTFHIRLLDLQGKCLSEWKPETLPGTKTIQVHFPENFPPGLYMLELQNPHHHQTFKICISQH